MATIFRGALILPRPRKRAIEVVQPPNRLLTALAIVTIAKASIIAPIERIEAQQPELGGSFRALLAASPTPVAQHQWPNPVPRSERQQPFPSGSAYGKTITVTDLAGGRVDVSFVIEDIRLREHHVPIQSTRSIALQGVAVVAPFVQTSWPNPVVKREVRPQLLWRMVAAEAETAPFKQDDWPQPGRPPVGPDVLPPNSAILIPVEQPFSIQPNLPTARREKIESHTLSTVVYEPEPPQPFGLIDWPRSGPRRAISLEQQSSALAGPLNTAQSVPFTQLDWPRIARRIARIQETPQPNLKGTLYVAQAQPFALYDWPTAELKFVREDHNRTNLLGTLPPPEIPFLLTEWPNPLRKADPHFDVWGQSLQHTTLFVENVKPFSQTDWNVGFLFDPKEIYPFVSYQPKVIVEGVGLPGLQPPTYIIGTMTVTFGIASPMNARGRSIDGEMQITFGVDGTMDTSDEFEGPV